MKKQTYVKVTDRFCADHQWPKAKRECIKNRHRHEFIVTVKLETSHDDRQVEFWDLRYRLKAFLRNNLEEQHTSRSCEQMAQLIWAHLERENYKPVQVDVSEDGISSGGVERRCNSVP